MSRLADRLLRPRARDMRPHPTSIKRIAVLLPCCLGDLLMATPVIRSLDQHFTSASIVVITQRWASGAVETNPRVDGIIPYPDERRPLDLAGTALTIRRQQFDLGVSLDRSPAVTAMLAVAGVRYRAGIDSGGRGVGLSHRVAPTPAQHETELFLSTLAPLGIQPGSTVPEYSAQDAAIAEISRLVPASSGSPLVVIHPGGAVNPGATVLEKRWPATSFGELASLLVHERGATVVLIGAESDRLAVDTVRDFARAPVIDLCEQLSLPQVAALCQRASLYVGNDSGVSHLAAAGGAPTVTIFGPTSPRRYRPLGRRSVVCALPDSWELDSDVDLRRVSPGSLPDIAAVPLPQVYNTCLDQIDGLD